MIRESSYFPTFLAILAIDVGKTDEIQLYPMSFSEFLNDSIGQGSGELLSRARAWGYWWSRRVGMKSVPTGKADTGGMRCSPHPPVTAGWNARPAQSCARHTRTLPVFPAEQKGPSRRPGYNDSRKSKTIPCSSFTYFSCFFPSKA